MKKKFRFKLAPVELLRKKREDEALRALGHAQKRFQDAVAFRADLVRTHDLSLARRESLGQEGFAPALDFQMESLFVSGQKQRIAQADQFIFRAKKLVNTAMREYIQARRQTRMIESLREKAFAEWKKEIARKEQIELDDLYVMRSRLIKPQDADAAEGDVA